MEHEIIVIGLNHRTAPVHVRERVAFAGERLEASNRRLRELDGVDEAAILSTFNRVEVVVSSCETERAVEQVGRTLLVNPGEVMGRFGLSTYAVYDTESGQARLVEVERQAVA